MWVFDGEQWTTDESAAGNESTRRDERSQQLDEFLPELQVIEVVQVPKTPNYVPYPHP